jgi:ferredoxin
VVCELSGERSAFPRRPIQYAIIGLKDLVKKGLDPWLCHDCGDCSITCPRQAEPQESMKTLRRYLTAVYDWTGIAGLINRSKAWYAGLVSAVAGLVVFLIYIYHSRWVGMLLSEMTSTPMGLEHMFNKIIYYTLIVVLFPFFILLTHAFRMWWFTMREEKIALKYYLEELGSIFLHMVTHRNIGKCPQTIHRKRRVTHWLLACGCVIMLVLVTFFLKWFQTDKILPFYHPQRWLGYLATIGMLAGVIDIFVERILRRSDIYKFSDFRDLMFPIMLFLTALTGILVHIFRYAGLEMATHYTYALHIIVTTPMLLVEIPFGRWSHMIYRPLAIYFYDVKERALGGVREEVARAA